jgi:hypothetical protein
MKKMASKVAITASSKSFDVFIPGFLSNLLYFQKY